MPSDPTPQAASSAKTSPSSCSVLDGSDPPFKVQFNPMARKLIALLYPGWRC
jgi:hypothetical protein